MDTRTPPLLENRDEWLAAFRAGWLAHYQQTGQVDWKRYTHPNNKTPGDYPLSWCKNYGKGRVFYTSLGHREDVWDPAWPDRKNPKEVAEAYQEHILGGIKWALGLEKWSPKPTKTTVE